jgi:hypothetical protein
MNCARRQIEKCEIIKTPYQGGGAGDILLDKHPHAMPIKGQRPHEFVLALTLSM